VSVPTGADSTRVLFAVPAIDVNSAAYSRLLVLVVMLILLVTVGFPLFIFVFLTVNRHRLYTESFIKRVGPLYEAFRADPLAVYGHVIMLLRRYVVRAELLVHVCS
jgi:hypothetical protein